MRYFLLLVFAPIMGCYRTWDWPKAPPRRNKNEQCIKIVNGQFFHVDDCKYWGCVPSSDGQAVLPP